MSLRLLRNGHTVEQSLREDHSLSEVDSQNGRLFIEQSVAIRPTWFNFIREFSSNAIPNLENKSCSALLFLEVTPDEKNAKPRTFSLAFGGGHHSLKPEAFERNFGLLVTLNSVARNNLRNLDVATLDATSFQKRIQASRNADLTGFGIDVESDLLRLAGGIPTDTTFANTLAGKDALTFTAKTSPSELTDKCKIALKLFNSDEYKKDFDFIDYIVPVRNKDEIFALDELAFAELKNLLTGHSSDLHLALPEIVNPNEGYEIGYFGLGLKQGGKTAYAEIVINDYIQELKAGHPDEITDMAALKTSHEIRVIKDGQGNKKERQRLYDCFVYEVEDAGNTYVLFSGEWYCIDKDFHTDVENSFKKIVSTKPIISSTKSKNERALIAELDLNPDLLNLDQTKASPAGAKGANLEPCDFLSRQKEFIHLKDGHASAPISHLWNQGVVSAESFVRDATFRNSLRSHVVKRQKKTGKQNFQSILPDGRSKPVPNDYTVVFGIMRSAYKKSGTLGLPFFSKVSLRPIAQRIELMGFKVEVHLIQKK